MALLHCVAPRRRPLFCGMLGTMRRAWMFAVFLTLLPFSAAAHPGPLDAKSCHYCKQDCERYGLQVAEYHCHIGGDRKTNFSFQQFWRFQRLLRKAKHPTLREIARRLRAKEAYTNTVVSSKLEECWPSLDPETGEQRAPLLARYRSLAEFGELFTAFVCKNPLETVPLLTPELNVQGGLRATLKRTPTPTTRATLTRAGFTCKNAFDAVACTQWTNDDPLIPASALKPLVSVASQIARLECQGCSDEEFFEQATSGLSSVSSAGAAPTQTSSAFGDASSDAAFSSAENGQQPSSVNTGQP